ncbi:MAG: hypothetical protein H6740_24650 [Alphaproteobacteria bacterium]|nr:hypothetical protein [Alphaproteobacteria bacterium]
MRSLSLLLLLGACDDDTSVKQSDDAPFDLSAPDAVLWGVDPENDGEDGFALLIIAEGDIDCASLSAENRYHNLDAFTFEGRGLVFALVYDDWDEREAAGNPWPGLWISGYAYSSGAERLFVPFAFSDGFLYRLGGYYGLGETSWLEIEDYTESGVSGSYRTEYWSGEFTAEHCGAWAEYQRPQDSWPWNDTW